MTETPVKRTLPDGFVEVPNERLPRITFLYNRFYLSKSLLRHFNLSSGDRVGLAYNPSDGSLLIDLKGRSFYIDARGYITSIEFAKVNRLIDKTVKTTFEYDEERSRGDFAIFTII